MVLRHVGGPHPSSRGTEEQSPRVPGEEGVLPQDCSVSSCLRFQAAGRPCRFPLGWSTPTGNEPAPGKQSLSVDACASSLVQLYFRVESLCLTSRLLPPGSDTLGLYLLPLIHLLLVPRCRTILEGRRWEPQWLVGGSFHRVGILALRVRAQLRQGPGAHPGGHGVPSCGGCWHCHVRQVGWRLTCGPGDGSGGSPGTERKRGLGSLCGPLADWLLGRSVG